MRRRVSILGTVGVPGTYGGFETLAENLVRYFADEGQSIDLSVYCSSRAYEVRRTEFLGAELRYIGLSANGLQSILYDIVSLFDSIRRKDDVILLLGVSGAIALPLVRLFSRAILVTNIDGIEWRRDKWRGLPKAFLWWSEASAVRWSHSVVADNEAISRYVRSKYLRDCRLIPYGGDHALSSIATPDRSMTLPSSYSLALCRIEPENNVSLILEAFSRMPGRSLVFVGNWSSSSYGRQLRDKYLEFKNINMIDAIYDPGVLRWIRDGAASYVHGHSAGGTNPSLVEMMHFGVPVFAFDCDFNRCTTDGKALFFDSASMLCAQVSGLSIETSELVGALMRNIATERYTWESVGRAYLDLICEDRAEAK